MSAPALLLLTAGTLGGGALLLRALGCLGRLPVGERPAWAFAAGFGLLGWAMFFLALAGALSPWAVGGLCALGLAGLPLLGGAWRVEARIDRWGWALLTLLAMLAGLDLIEAMAPPADADSLAYHFAIPKEVLAAGHLIFFPRAVDGAIPLLCQMTYLAALDLGGERGMTLWCAVSGWGAAALLFALARRRMDFNAALALTLVWQTVPLVVAAAGSGQIEVRLAMFATTAAFAAAEASGKGGWRFAALAGLFGGFLAASKYPGLFIVAAVGLALAARPGRVGNSLAFGLAVAVAGCQWYGWNWWNTGDPVFPMLFGKIAYRDGVPWNAAQQTFMASAFFGSEKLVPQNLWWLLAYPFKATLEAQPVFESGRTGLGPAPLLLLPFAVAGLALRRGRMASLAVPAAIVALTYAAWFLFGPSQRVRHLAPLLPTLLLVMGASALPATKRLPVLSRPLAAATAMVLLLQTAGAGIYSLNYLRHLLGSEGRDAFLERNVSGYDLAHWLNGHLVSDDRVAVQQRQLNYYLDVPYFYVHGYDQAEIEIRPESLDPMVFWQQLRRANITHLAANLEAPGNGGFDRLATQLTDSGCGHVIAHVEARQIGSRTLPEYGTHGFDIVELAAASCPLPVSRKSRLGG